MSEYQQILFAGPTVRIGTFTARPEGERFHNTGPIGGYLIVFPRLPVLITHTGGQPIAANPNLVMFYNSGQEYRRDALSPLGDQCQWFGFSEATVRKVLRCDNSPIPCQAQQIFQMTNGLVETGCYTLQRSLIEYLSQTTRPDPVFVEETALKILAAAIRSSKIAQRYSRLGKIAVNKTTDQEITHCIEKVIAERFREKLSLEALADEVQYSPFYISHLFQQQTGQAIHQYISQLRLRTAFEQILSGEENLTRLALDLGFSSHSHFTQSFHQTFGQQPSALRKTSFSYLFNN